MKACDNSNLGIALSAMKLLVVLFASVLGWSFKGVAQTTTYVTINSTSNTSGVNYAVQTNQIVSVVGYDWANIPSLSVNLADGTPFAVTLYQTFSPTGIYGSTLPQTVTGVTNIIVKPNNATHNQGWATFQITTPCSTTSVSTYVPADAVVIPSSAIGNVQIILESSSDLVNWNAANPGIYGASSTTNRFFRVRAVIQ